MKTFLEIARENKEIARERSAHEINRARVNAYIGGKDLINTDWGIQWGVSCFTISVWNKAGSEKIGDYVLDVEKGAITRRDCTQYSTEAIKTIIDILVEYPEEVEFGTESFYWLYRDEEGDCGYIYPAKEQNSNMGQCRSREELEFVVNTQIKGVV